MTLVVLQSTTIIGVYDSESQASVRKYLTKAGISYSEIRHISNSTFAGVSGQDIREFDEEYVLRPLSARIAEGYVTLSPSEILDGETVREKTQIEKYVDGTDVLPEGWKLSEDNTQIVPKSVLERLEDAEIPFSEAKDLLMTTVKNISTDAIYASYPMHVQQNILEECMYGANVIAYEREMTSDAVNVEMNVLVYPLNTVEELITFRSTIDTLDLSAYLLEPTGQAMKSTTRSRCAEYYRTLLKALVCRRLKYYVRTWCRNKEEYIESCNNTAQLVKLDTDDCPTI